MTNFMDSLRRGLDRAGFEADKLMRYNRVRSEASRLHSQGAERMRAVGEMAVALYKAGALKEPELIERAREILDLEARAQQKEEESNAIQAEAWVEPPDTNPPTPSVNWSGSQSPNSSVPTSAYNPPPAFTPSPQSQLEDQGTRRVPDPTHTDYCPNCGGPLRPNAVFCSQCGTRV